MDKNGIYMPNRPWAKLEEWEKFRRAKFKWAVVRTDSSPDMAKLCVEQGAKVIVQLPDHWNRDPFSNPFSWAQECIHAVSGFERYSEIVVLDNEPNLGLSTGTQWHAEEFTRWYRVVAAAFRYLDKACHWKLCFPAICHPHDDLGQYWLRTNVENIQESEYVGIHSYWHNTADFEQTYGMREVKAYNICPEGLEYLVLEYGTPDRATSGQRRGVQDTWFLRELPCNALAGCKFILGGTNQWSDFFLSNEEAEALGAMG
jgi:hypothetical protein